MKLGEHHPERDGFEYIPGPEEADRSRLNSDRMAALEEELRAVRGELEARRVPFFRRLFRRRSRVTSSLSSSSSASAAADGPEMASLIQAVTRSQFQQIESTAQFVKLVHELSVERVAGVLGRKGGKARAATALRDARGRMLPGRIATIDEVPLGHGRGQCDECGGFHGPEQAH